MRIGLSRMLLKKSRRRRSCAACKIIRNFKVKGKHRQSFAWMAVDNDSGQSRRGCLCDPSSTNDFIRNHKPRNDSVWPASRSVPVFFSFFLLGTGKTDGNWLLVEKMRQEIDSRPMRGTTLVFNDFWSLLTLKQGSWLWYIQDKRKSFSFPMERTFVFPARWKMPFL